GLGGLTSENIWSTEQYAWMYVLIMVCLMVSRAIGRGAMFASSKVPLAKYARSASVSYVVGYAVAALIAILVSLGSESSQVHTTLSIGFMTIATLVVAWYLEKQGDISALVPVWLQLGLLSLLRPLVGDSQLTSFLLISSTVAVLSYVVSKYFVFTNKTDRYV